MADNPKYISKITLPSGSTYDIKDAKAWEDIAALSSTIQGGVHYIGKTTTALSDGATTNPITIDDKSVTAKQGDMVSYSAGEGDTKDLEFIFNGTKWYELGSTGSLKALAFKDSASATYTPVGSVSQPTFSGSEMTAEGSYTPAGTLDAPAFTGTAGSVSVTGTTNGDVSQPTFTGTEGNISVSGTATGNVELGGSTEQAVGISITTSENGNYQPDGTIS